MKIAEDGHIYGKLNFLKIFEVDELLKILSTSVLEVFVILVGSIIWGRSEKEPKMSKTLENEFSVSKLNTLY